MIKKAACSLGLMLSIAGCGGGGSDGGATNSSNAGSVSQPKGMDIQAVGRYKGKVTTGRLPIFQDLVVSPDGRFAIYYEDAFGSSRGFVDGLVSGDGGQFNGTTSDYSQAGVSSGSISGQYRPGVGLSGSAIYASGPSNFELKFSEYMTLATGAADAKGTWNASDEMNSTLTVSIDSSQSIKVAINANCQFSGAAKFSNGANTGQIANLSGTSSGTGCRFGTGSMSGLVAVTYPNNGYVRIQGHAIRSDRRDGFSFSSVRCPSTKTVQSILSC